MSPIASLLTLVLGSVAAWTPRVLESWHEGRRQRRAALGLVLAALLEVRLHVRLRHELSEIFAAIDDEKAKAIVFNTLVMKALPSTETLAEGYATAIRILSQEVPVLAFRMRHLDKVVVQMQKIPREFAAFVEEVGTAEDQAVFALIVENGHSGILETLEDAIFEIARLHGIRTLFRTRSFFRNEVSFKEFLRDQIDGMSEPARSQVIQAIPDSLGIKLP